MEVVTGIILANFVAIFLCSEAASGLKGFDELYADGIEAYWNEDWKGCITSIENSLESYRLMKEGFKKCSLKCSSIPNDPSQVRSAAAVFIIEKAACLERCNKETFDQPDLFSRVSQEVKDTFKHKKPYVYLQFAYFRNGDYADSLAATYTYAQYDPEDHMMQENMKYFLNNENSTKEMFVNREFNPHLITYDSGVDAYNREDYDDAVVYFEEALDQYFDAEAGCRAMCEGEYNVGTEVPTPFHAQIVDHYKDVLECYMTCPDEVARVTRTFAMSNHLPKQYEFLHYVYFELGDMKKAAECAKSYLLFFPESEIFTERLKLFNDAETTQPREEAVRFHRRLQLQSSLLKYIYVNFGIRDYDENILTVYKSEDVDEDLNEEDVTENSPPEIAIEAEDLSFDPVQQDQITDDTGAGYESMHEKREDLIAAKDSHNERMTELKQRRIEDADTLRLKGDVDISHLYNTPIGHQVADSKFMVDIVDASSFAESPSPEGPILFQSALLANSSQMSGPLRFALDGFATEEECQQLVDLELSGGISGDGYRGKASPHTKHELFQGITVHRAAQLAASGDLPVEPARLYYDISERIRQQVKAYFKLDKELYFDYTHLVCRTAINDEGSSSARKDNSHPVHGDNCILFDDARCIKQDPAYTWRDYSSIMYINSDFGGGQFVMTDATARRAVVQVKPKCGRLVSFCAGKECLHGVKPVTRGRRCAMALWFTLDPSHNEQLRIEAKKILDSISDAKDEL